MTDPADPDLAHLQGAATRACTLLKALANPDRMQVLCLLPRREHCVGELERALGIRQSALSQQLAVLREHGLVRTRREGTNIHYAIASTAALAMIGVLNEQFCTPGGDTDDRRESC